MNPIVQTAFEQAKATRENAYAKFSNFLVGSAIKLKGSDEIYTGCNVENSTYGLTICAERTAITKAVSLKGKIDIDFVVVVADTPEPTFPCGMCRQTICEFGTDDTKIYLANLEGIQKETTLKEIFPDGFRL